MRKLIRILGLVVLATLINTHVNAQAIHSGETTEGVIKAYKAGDFIELDKLASKLRTEKTRTPSGRWLLSVFYANLNAAIIEDRDKNTELQWANIEGKLNRWVAASPQSATAPIALATAQQSHAWALRGHGFANTVSPKGWEDFAKYMEVSRNTLEANKKISSHDPQWYVVMLRVALAQGWKQEQYWALYEEALSKEPLYYQTYFQAAERIIPMWGGSMQEIQDFAADAVRRTASAEGSGMYARIYWAASGRVGAKEFFAMPHRDAVWSQMKAGFEAVIKIYPDDYNRNAYAKFACQVGDVDTFITVTRSFNGKPDKDIWPGDFFQKCKDYAAAVRPGNPL